MRQPHLHSDQARMLRVTVGLSRKLSHDFNSAGVSVSLEGELSSPLHDPDALLEEVRVLHDLAEEAVADRLTAMGYDPESGGVGPGDAPPEGPSPPPGPATRRGRDRAPHVGGRDAVSRNGRGEAPPTNGHAGNGRSNGRGNGYAGNGRAASKSAPQNAGGRGDDAATDKQVKFLVSLGKRSGLTGRRLVGRIGEICGREASPYDLSKAEAGAVIDELNDRE